MAPVVGGIFTRFPFLVSLTGTCPIVIRTRRPRNLRADGMIPSNTFLPPAPRSTQTYVGPASGTTRTTTRGGGGGGAGFCLGFAGGFFAVVVLMLWPPLLLPPLDLPSPAKITSMASTRTATADH